MRGNLLVVALRIKTGITSSANTNPNISNLNDHTHTKESKEK